MFRDRTNLFLSYRRTVPRHSAPARFVALAEEEEGLMSARRIGPAGRSTRDAHGEAVEMTPLAPSIFGIAAELDRTLAAAKRKTADLAALYKKLLLTRDKEKEQLEHSIEALNYDITRMFEACYVLVKKFVYLQNNHRRLALGYTADEVAILENYKKAYAVRIQDTSVVFRNLQNNYIKFLHDDDDDEATLLSSPFADPHAAAASRDIEDYSKQVLHQAQQQMSAPDAHLLASRERDISKLAMGILEISTIFKEMESLVVDQGSMLDRIDYNISRTAEDLRASDRELLRAQGYQKRTTKCKVIFLLCLVVLALFIVVVVKPHGKTVEAPAPPPKDAASQGDTRL